MAERTKARIKFEQTKVLEYEDYWYFSLVRSRTLSS